MRIGLFGGTFDPPHAGHVLASERALRRLQLDRVWWIVTPGNPLKAHDGLTPLAERMAEARALARDPRIVVSDIEAQLGTRYTFDTIDWLTKRCPGVSFVWIMGADNLAQFDRWQHWREIAARVPLAVVDRPGASLAATASRAARVLAPWRLSEAQAPLLATLGAPGLVLLHGRRIDLSSTMLRKERAVTGS
jgi:nicotinate-nucleotide adenylyltransferase